MNLPEKAEQIDYEPDVLKFKQIWNEMKQNAKQTPKETEKMSTLQRGESKNKKKQKKNAGSLKRETVVSKKNINSNLQSSSDKVIQIVTQPQGFFNDNLQNQKNMGNPETLLQANPKNIYPAKDIDQFKQQISQKDYELSLLRVSNSRIQQRVRQLQSEIGEKQKTILSLKGRQRELLTQISHLNGKQMVFDYGKVEYQNFKNDTRRLLKMLQTTSEYQQFASLALDDNCVRFLNSVNQNHHQKSKNGDHSKTDEKFFSETKNLNSWVPEKIYSFGKEFIKEKKGQITVSELELLLYELNKIWREREKRIINTINSQKAKDIGVLKRKLQNISYEKNKKK